MEVIYLISPTTSSLELLVRGFTDPAKPKYGDVHLFFLSKVDNEGMAILSGCPVSSLDYSTRNTKLHPHARKTSQVLIDRVKTFKEINVNYLAVESQVFHSDQAARAHVQS